MKYFFKFFLLLSLLFPINSYSNENIAIVDVDLLFSKSKKGQIIISKLNEIKNNNEIEIKKKEEIILNLDKNIKLKKNLINENELNKMVSEMNILLKDIKSFRDGYLNEYENIKNEQLSLFFNEISPIIEKYIATNSIKIVIDKKNIFIADQKNDITQDLLKIINDKIK